VSLNGPSSIEEANQFQQRAKEEGKKIEIQSYPDVPAGFCNESNTKTYSPEAAQRAWKTTVEFLNGILKAS